MTKICRICLNCDNNSHWIFDNNKNYPAKMDVMIFITTSVTVLEIDKVTQYLCEKCANSIVEMYKFRLLAIENDQILKARTKMEIKKEQLISQIASIHTFPKSISLATNNTPSFVNTNELINSNIQNKYSASNDSIINNILNNNDVDIVKTVPKCLTSILAQDEGNSLKSVNYNGLVITPMIQTNSYVESKKEKSNSALEIVVVPQGTSIRNSHYLGKKPENDVIRKSHLEILENLVINASEISENTALVFGKNRNLDNSYQSEKTVNKTKSDRCNALLNRYLNEDFHERIKEEENQETVQESNMGKTAQKASPIEVVMKSEKDTKKQITRNKKTKQTAIKRKLENDDLQNKSLRLTQKEGFLNSLDLVPVNVDDSVVLSKVSKYCQIYTCKICNYVYDSLKDLRKHERKQHSRCTFCKRKFRKNSMLMDHVKECVHSLKPTIQLPIVDSIKLIKEKYPKAFSFSDNLLSETIEEGKEKLSTDIKLDEEVIKNNYIVFEQKKTTGSIENLPTIIENTSRTDIIYISNDETEDETTETVLTVSVISEPYIDSSDYKLVINLTCLNAKTSSDNLLNGYNFYTSNLIIMKKLVDIIRHQKILPKNDTVNLKRFKISYRDGTVIFKNFLSEVYKNKFSTIIKYGKRLQVSFVLACKPEPHKEKHFWNNLTPIDC